MVLIITNSTANPLNYLSGAVTIPANSGVAVSSQYLYPISRDAALINDCLLANVSVNDGVAEYTTNNAVNYLNQIATSIGGAVVGLVGAPVPSYVILVGGKDPSGNTVLGNFDTLGNLKTSNNIDTSGQNRAQSITTSAAEALGAATILANRKFISLTPTNGTIYWGFTNGVTTSSGNPIFKNQTVTLTFTSSVHVYVIAGSTVDCRIAEGS